MSGDRVISSVLSHHSKDLKWWTSVTVWLQLSFIWRAKYSTPSSCEDGPTPKERSQSVLASSFYMFVSPTLSLPSANWASQEGGVFVSPEVLTPVHGFSFAPFSQDFFLLCLLATAIWTPFSYSTYLTIAPFSNSFISISILICYFCCYLCIYSLYHMINEEVKNKPNYLHIQSL